MVFVESRPSSSKREQSGDNDADRTADDNEKAHEDNVTMHKTHKENAQNLGCDCVISWLREDCLEFYRTNLLHLPSDPSSGSLARRSPATQVKDRVGLLRLGINRAMVVKKRFPDAQFLEFGVHEGKDLVRMATFLRSVEEKKSSKPNCTNRNDKPSYTTFHGFDSFEGLPEDWDNGQFGADNKPLHKRGAFDTGGETPDVNHLVNNSLRLGEHGRTNCVEEKSSFQSRVAQTTIRVDNIEVHKGWFHDSLPKFLDDHDGTPVAFVHADADLYSSTLTFLRLICERRLFRKGSVIVFDEFWNYPNWENGEYKAWLEIVNEFGLEFKYEYFGYHAPHPSAKKFKQYGYQSVGVVITRDAE